MTPTPDVTCEVCGQGDLKILIDGRVRQGKYGPKGHWIWLCPSCHRLHGLGYGEDDLVIYERFIGRYFEVKGKIELKAPEIQNCIAGHLNNSPVETHYLITFLGEIALQLAINNDLFQQSLDLARHRPEAFAKELMDLQAKVTPSTAETSFDQTTFDNGKES